VDVIINQIKKLRKQKDIMKKLV